MGNPKVTPITENWHTGGFVVSEARGHLSYEQKTLSSTFAGVVLAGTMLATITDAGTAPVYAANGGNTGNFTCGVVAPLANAQVGAYSIVFTAATKFNVFDPLGNFVGAGSTGVAFAKQVGFTLTAGGVAAVVGDNAIITVAADANAGKVVPYDPTAINGAQIATGIAYEGGDVTTLDKQITVMVRTGEYNLSEIVWGANVTTTPQKNAAIAALAANQLIGR